MNTENRKPSGLPEGVSKRTVFDPERLDVNQLELRFIEWVTPLLEEALQKTSGKPREVCEQLDRASLSSLLNTAEGNGRRQRQGSAKFFDDARGSATECAGCLDALAAKKIFAQDRIQEGKAILLRVVSMLCKLADRFDEGRLHEDSAEYRVAEDQNSETRMEEERISRTRTRTRTRTNQYGPNQN